MSTWDLYEDGFPHGTPAGYVRGCKGANCPAALEHGMSCSKAKQYAAGDYRYRRLAGAGMSPAEIAKALDEQPIVHEAPKPRVVVPEEDEPALIEREEPIMTTTTAPTPATIIKSTKPEPQPVEWPDEEPVQGDAQPAGNFETFAKPSQSKVREWAHRHGIDVNPRGSVRADVMAAYLAVAGGDPVEADDESAPGPSENAQGPATAERLDEIAATLDARPHQTQGEENEPTTPTDEGGVSEAVTEAHTAESTVTDLAQFIASTEVAIAQSKQTTAETALEFALKAWARERVRAEQAEEAARVWRASARMFHDLWESAETVVTADIEIIATLDTLIREQAATIEQQRRPWWKRGAA